MTEHLSRKSGEPPRDRSRAFVGYFVLLLVAGWALLPVALTLALNPL